MSFKGHQNRSVPYSYTEQMASLFPLRASSQLLAGKILHKEIIHLNYKKSTWCFFLHMAGEMSHHDVLDAVANGISVILCEHSNTERGFLSELRDTLTIHLQNKINIILSEKDRDPLQVV